MRCKVLSLHGVEFEGDTKSLGAKSVSGEITVLDHHHPIMTVLVRGTVTAEGTSGIRKEIEIESGFLEMDDQNNLTVLIN
ncbi:MAG: hypothetical protein EXS68_02005 [Candidatus Ryanbacteria bacterium]|nr:hypothetical protein [Candidatus Ryanbacteria bacterium]